MPLIPILICNFETAQHELGSETESRLSDSRPSDTFAIASPAPKSDEKTESEKTVIREVQEVREVVPPPAPRPSIDQDQAVSRLSESSIKRIQRQKTSDSLIKSPVDIIIEDAAFSAAKFRWIQAVNKIRVKLRETNQQLVSEKMRKSNWGAQAIASNFLSSIDSMPNFKPRRKSIPLVSEISAALMLKNKSGISSVLASRSPQDNELKLHVYRKSLQALVYPISNTTPHTFEVYSAPRPVYCDECRGFLWGVARQGQFLPDF